METKVDVQENLSYYPAGKSIRQREYPSKDTVLNTNWQYWARFDNPGFFKIQTCFINCKEITIDTALITSPAYLKEN
ncbi:MAG: hypothetical protein IPF72_17685 [Chitinophagaceae bacterium]|nr:hypothetical protein [Chitinophagaceae bacterium]